MPTWGEIYEFTRSKYKLSVEEPERFALIWAYDDGRSQQIFCRRFEAFNQEMIEFRTPVCKENEMPHTVALRKNSELAIGALVLENGHIFLMHNALLRNLDMEEFELPLHVLARTADNLEKDYSSGNDDY
jgi:hypothetical protein